MPKKISPYRKKIKESPPPSARGLAASRSSRPPLVRMVKLHELLVAGKFPNCRKLGEEFEVSSKTIQRDIEFMRDQLVLPIEYDAQSHGYFYARTVAQFPMITVSQGELVALLVAQKAVEQYRGTSFEKPLHAAFEKLVSSLGDEASVSLHDLSEAVSFRSAGVPQGQITVFEILADAVMTSQVVEFDYVALRAQTTERRRVEPYHLACISNQWYLIARDLARNGMRTFAVTRVVAPKNQKLAFQRPADFSAAEMLAGSFSAFEAGRVEKIRIRFDPFAARLAGERQWHKSQKLKPLPDGGADLTIQVGIAPDLESWILGWGGHAEVLEPAKLRESVAQTVREMMARYDGGCRALDTPAVGGCRALAAQNKDQEYEAQSVEGDHAFVGSPEVGCEGPHPSKKLRRQELKRSEDSLRLAQPESQQPAPLQGVGRRHPPHFSPVEGHNKPVILLVTVCTKNRQPILANPKVFELLQRVWKDAKSWQVGRFVLMPDHLHLFCAPGEPPEHSVGQWVRYWKAAVSRQWPHPEEQPIWQADFWDRQLRQDEHYAERWDYVRENPVRAGLVPDAAEWLWQGEINELRW